MAGLRPGHPRLCISTKKDVDARVKPAHDDVGRSRFLFPVIPGRRDSGEPGICPGGPGTPGRLAVADPGAAQSLHGKRMECVRY
jgi:hypothetical protein